MNLSRVLHPDDYGLFEEHLAIEKVMSKLTDYRYEHEHRKWEYGLALKAVLSTESRTVLDVGGAGAILSPLLFEYGFDITQLDPEFGEESVKSQNKILGADIKFISGDFSTVTLDNFDSVVSISTIEHVQDDVTFFKELLNHANKSVFITMDFFPTCETFSKYHLRTYNKDRIIEFCRIAEDIGFTSNISNYDYRGNFVYDYTFASLFLIRNSK